MRFIILIFFCLNLFLGSSQSVVFPEHLKKTNMAILKTNDSLIYYQCHVEVATQQLLTASGEKISGKAQKYTITDKYIVVNKNNQYHLRYFSSSLVDYPNKKFAYLKLVEKPYWNFKLVKDTIINEHDVFVIAALENKSHETTEYDFKINHQNTNEIIIMGGKVMSQLIVEGDYTFKKNLEMLK